MCSTLDYLLLSILPLKYERGKKKARVLPSVYIHESGCYQERLRAKEKERKKRSNFQSPFCPLSLFSLLVLTVERETEGSYKNRKGLFSSSSSCVCFCVVVWFYSGFAAISDAKKRERVNNITRLSVKRARAVKRCSLMLTFHHSFLESTHNSHR